MLAYILQATLVHKLKQMQFMSQKYVDVLPSFYLPLSQKQATTINYQSFQK